VARIRTIKPEFPQSESVGRLSRDARLLFLQLLTVADDFGRLRAAIPVLAGQLYPYDSDAAELLPLWLEELRKQDHIARYVTDGTIYIQISGWSKHQRTDNAAKSRIPPPPPFSGGLSENQPPAPTSQTTFDLPANHPENSEHLESTAVRRELPRVAAVRGLDLGPRTKEKKDSVGPSGPTLPGGKQISEVEEDFNKLFWKPYPRTPTMSRKDTLSAWLKMTPTDRDAAAQAVPKYAKWLAAERAKRPDMPAVHAVRFITQRRFEGFLEPPDPEAPPAGEPQFKHGDTAPVSAGRLAGYIYLKTETVEWDAWREYQRKHGYKSSPVDKFGGWFFPTRSPPA
jgi:hypothetical protein